MATLIDTLLVSLKLDDSQFSDSSRRAIVSNDRLAQSVDNVSQSSDQASGSVGGLSENLGEAKESSDQMTKSVYGAVKALAGLFSAIFVSTGLSKLINETSQANDKLNFLSKNLGMTAKNVSKWQGAAEMAGGSADGMASSLTNLSKSLWDMVTTGDTALIPYFTALNVSVTDSAGNLRNLDDILLDVADSFSKMKRPQAYNIAKSMGFDEGTINMLLQGRAAMEAQLAAQENIVVSSEKELEISRKLNESNSLVVRQWEGLKTTIGNYLTPYFLKFSQKVSKWMDYLNQNKGKAISLFKGVAAVIGLTLIPLAIAAGKAFILMFAPLLTGAGLIVLLVIALRALYDDYQTWKRGGKSLIDWDEWEPGINSAVKGITDLGKEIKKLALELTNLLGIDLKTWSIEWELKNAKKHFSELGEMISLIIDLLNAVNEGRWSDAAGIGKRLINQGQGNPSATPVIEDSANSAAEWVRDTFGVDPRSIGNWFGEAIGGVERERRGSNPTASSVDVPNQFKRVYKTTDGDLVKEDGSRSWRNNNPGNMIWGDYAKKMGAIGRDMEAAGHVMAIFPDEETGRKAQRNLIFESNGGRKLSTTADYGAGIGYKNKTLSQAITAYAPPEAKNPTTAYIRKVLAAVGSEKTMGNYSESEREKILEAMKEIEDWKEGKQYASNSSSNTIQGLQSFGNQISKPLVSGIENGGNQFMAQSQKLSSQPSVVNNKVDVQIGDINVQTSASTITGVVADAKQAAAERIYQLVPSMG